MSSLRDKTIRALLYMLLLEIALLVFQYALAGEYRRESLKIIEAKGKISRETSGNAFRRDHLSCYETDLAELESALPRSVASEAEAVSFVTARLRGHGIATIAEEAAHKGEEIGIVVCAESAYKDVLLFFAGLQQDAPAVGVRELLVQALDGEQVRFSAEIVFFRTREGEHGSIR